MSNRDLSTSQTLIADLNRFRTCLPSILYDQLDFNSGYGLAIRKAIIELTDSGACILVHNRSRGWKRFQETFMVSYVKDKQILPSHHNRKLYVTVYARNLELWHAFNPRSLINIMHLLTLEVVGIPQDRVVKHLTEVSSFGGNTSFILGYINFDLVIEQTRATSLFHVIDARTSYHLLLGRHGIYKHKGVPFTNH